MSQTIKCPKCGSEAALLEKGIMCWCDKDYCNGENCGASELYEKFKCTNQTCGHTGTPPDTVAYHKRHMD